MLSAKSRTLHFPKKYGALPRRRYGGRLVAQTYFPSADSAGGAWIYL